MFLTNRQVFLDRINDTRQMLCGIERLLYKLPDESGVYAHNQARLVAWAHLDTAWGQAYHVWSLLSGEECQVRMGEHQEGE